MNNLVLEALARASIAFGKTILREENEVQVEYECKVETTANDTTPLSTETPKGTAAAPIEVEPVIEEASEKTAEDFRKSIGIKINSLCENQEGYDKVKALLSKHNAPSLKDIADNDLATFSSELEQL